MKASRITILTHDPRWKGLAATVKRAAEAALTAQRKTHAAVTIVLSNDAEVKTLNRDYRKKDKPTNVLAFPDGTTHGRFMLLGDIILAYETIAQEAAAQGKKLKDHVAHLSVHGVLHLLGHDHEQEAAAQAMESLEIKILSRMGIANPYAEE